MPQRLYGIRHHGPGSARSLLQAFSASAPDCIVIEAPAELATVIQWVNHEQMQPPVALLVYEPENPRSSMLYPFVSFSPEWQAMLYGLKHSIPLRFMDLPSSVTLAWQKAKLEALQAEASTTDEEMVVDETLIEPAEADSPTADPIGLLASAAGFSDRERWWEYMVEHRRDSEEVFHAVHEAMVATRAEIEPIQGDELERDILREAWMRQVLRSVKKEGFENIAVVCGAWHTPALAELGPAKNDADLLKGLPKCKVQATWVPWSYGRLCSASGYSAGVESPGWYDHLWSHNMAGSSAREVTISWLTKSACLFRRHDYDTSPAQVIDAVRLAEGTASLRGLPLPGLDELNDATRAVFCFGEHLPMELLHRDLVVGERLGLIPADAPWVALQLDFQKAIKRLRLAQSQDSKVHDLDLRKQNDLEKSHLLHRLQLLGVPWGMLQRTAGRVRGTFHEIWELQWKPEFSVAVIEASLWGTTISDAATAYVRNRASRANTVAELTALVQAVLLADLSHAVPFVVRRLQALAAVASDAAQLMDALPPLSEVLRYGNVRNTDSDAVEQILQGLLVRIAVGLGNACASLDDEAAEKMYGRLMQTNSAIKLLDNPQYTDQWTSALHKLAVQLDVHGLVSGRANRLLFDAGEITADDAATRLSFALSSVSDAALAASWAEGFLRESGLLLILDEKLLRVVDEWICSMHADTFDVLLPLIRRTFSTFPMGERRQIADKIMQGQTTTVLSQPDNEQFDHETANAVLELMEKIIGNPS